MFYLNLFSMFVCNIQSPLYLIMYCMTLCAAVGDTCINKSLPCLSISVSNLLFSRERFCKYSLKLCVTSTQIKECVNQSNINCLTNSKRIIDDMNKENNYSEILLFLAEVVIIIVLIVLSIIMCLKYILLKLDFSSCLFKAHQKTM